MPPPRARYEWMQTLPCGCADVYFADGTVDREHDHVECAGLPIEGAPVLSEPIRDKQGNIAFVQEWYCMPPGGAVPTPGDEYRFRVPPGSDHWRDEKPPVREIHAWEPV